ncbi:MAG TPA: hypothetical protein VHP81_06695, partial [Lachnospiraceae bacterium]|nr:hypothetical protein [Lachnospiraceae bacterium]
LCLQAQFYYAILNSTLGDYQVTPGIFVCGVVELFNKLRIRALFSFREQDGVIAFAQISELDLGFIKLTGSHFEQPSVNPLPANSLFNELIDHETSGAVFYLSASNYEVSFYLDAYLELLGIFQCDARIIYTSGYVSLDTSITYLLITMTLHLKAQYSDFSSANFEFYFCLDTSKLEERLRGVQQSIESAIIRCRQSIDNAMQSLNQAQQHVNELYGQINHLDNCIQSCRDTINNTSRWKRWIVKIAKGIEIAAYEVAKAGIYISIGVATAALDVAKAATNFAGTIGENVLNFVNGVIDTAMNLFFIKKIELFADASMQSQAFRASISFVALGKTYEYTTSFDRNQLGSNPTDLLSDSMNNQMKPDLDNIENGSFRSNRSRFKPEVLPLSEHRNRLLEGLDHIHRSTTLLMQIQAAHIDEFKEALPESDEMNHSYLDALNYVTNSLDVMTRSVNIDDFSTFMQDVETKINDPTNQTSFRSSDISTAKEAIQKYKETKDFYNDVTAAIDRIHQHKANVDQNHKQNKELLKQLHDDKIYGTSNPGTMSNVINKVESLLYEHFPPTQGSSYYINLSKEPSIHEELNNVREYYQAPRSPELETSYSRATSP